MSATGPRNVREVRAPRGTTLSCRSWQTEAVIPEKGCIRMPGLSALSGWK